MDAEDRPGDPARPSDATVQTPPDVQPSWKARNPERARELNRESMRRTAARRRALERKRAHGRAWYWEHAEQERERGRRFRAEHPDRVREYQRRYMEKHPDRARAQLRQATSAWRDRNADAVRAAQRELAAQRREADPEVHRRYYQAHLEQQRARSRDAARLRRRLASLGLPPRQRHRVYANERRANDAAADAFFAARRTKPQLRALELEKSAAPHARLARAESRRALRGQRATAAPVTDEMRTAHRLEARRQIWANLIPDLVRSYVERHRDTIREEIRLDDIARRVSGKPARDAATELARRIRIEVFKAVADQLVPDHAPAALGELHTVMFPRYTAALTQAPHAEPDERVREAQRLLAASGASGTPDVR